VPPPKLTDTQQEVLLLCGDGYTAVEIGEIRGTGPDAAEHVVATLKKKFGVKRKSELVRCSNKYFSHAR
jgi:DNA-binding CsgD family transcriptional regulator